MDPPRKRIIVIIGGGVIGCTTAYFLTRHPKFDPELHTLILLEAASIAAGASGKAGGLLGLWAYPECLVPLSYRLHRELAGKHGGAERWGYRRLGCASVRAMVKSSDLKSRSEQKPPQTSLVPVPVPVPVHVPVPVPAPAPAPVPAAAEQLPTAENGPTHADPPIIQVATPEKDESKTWEKLPKQDEKAAALLSESSLPSDLDWVDGKLINHYEEMGLPGFTETAQVHPFDFTNSMADLAREKGVDIRLRAKVTKINHSKAGVRSIEYEDRDKAGEIRFIDDVTDVVIAAGPWTGKLLPRSKVEGLKSHSVVFDADVSPYAVFTEIQLPTDYVPEHRAARGQKRKHRGNVDPEIYARPGNEVYACGEHDWSTPLPETADLVQPDEVQCDDLIAYIGTVSPVLGAAPIKAKQACYLPRHVRFGEDRGPLIGQTTVPGLWVASGHTCWGIQNGPATGCLMSELLLDGATHSADIDKLHPKKFKV